MKRLLLFLIPALILLGCLNQPVPSDNSEFLYRGSNFCSLLTSSDILQTCGGQDTAITPNNGVNRGCTYTIFSDNYSLGGNIAITALGTNGSFSGVFDFRNVSTPSSLKQLFASVSSGKNVSDVLILDKNAVIDSGSFISEKIIEKYDVVFVTYVYSFPNYAEDRSDHFGERTNFTAISAYIYSTEPQEKGKVIEVASLAYGSGQAKCKAPQIERLAELVVKRIG